MRISNRITDGFKPVIEPRTQRSRHNFFLFLGEKKPRAAFSPGRVVGRGGICCRQSKKKLAQF